MSSRPRKPLQPIRLTARIHLEIDPAALLEGLRPIVSNQELRRTLRELLRAHFDALEWSAPGDDHALPSYEDLQQWLIHADAVVTTD